VVNPARETLVSDNLVWPNALAVDFTGKQVTDPQRFVGLARHPSRFSYEVITMYLENA